VPIDQVLAGDRLDGPILRFTRIGIVRTVADLRCFTRYDVRYLIIAAEMEVLICCLAKSTLSWRNSG